MASKEDLQFVDYDDEDLSGGKPATAMRGYLSNKGLGWMFEIEDEDEIEGDDKPLLEELDIDVTEIVAKVKCVLFPFHVDRTALMKNPDFWGPLLVVIAYSALLIWGQWKVLSWIIWIWFVGSFLMSLLARVLGGSAEFAQTLGVMGYSVLPLCISVLVTNLPVLNSIRILVTILRLAAVAWASFSAATLLVTDSILHKRILLVYPVFLFYILLSSFQ